jgi:hypothetical protein
MNFKLLYLSGLGSLLLFSVYTVIINVDTLAHVPAFVFCRGLCDHVSL